MMGTDTPKKEVKDFYGSLMRYKKFKLRNFPKEVFSFYTLVKFKWETHITLLYPKRT